MSQNEFNVYNDDPYAEPKFRKSEFRVVFASLVFVLIIAVLAVTGVFKRAGRYLFPPKYKWPVNFEAQPKYKIMIAKPVKVERYRLINLQVKYHGIGRLFGTRFDDYEFKGTIIRPTAKVSSSARLFITLKTGLIKMKKDQKVLENLKVGQPKNFSIRIPDYGYARLRNRELVFIIMAGEEQPTVEEIIP
jgi:hypothetical protein